MYFNNHPNDIIRINIIGRRPFLYKDDLKMLTTERVQSKREFKEADPEMST